MITVFTIQGKSIPKARPRATMISGKAIMYTPTQTKQFERYVKSVAAQHAPREPLIGALEVQLDFFLPRPKSLPIKIKYHTKKPDIDNLAKSVLDAMEGIIYVNDAQVISLLVTKDYGAPLCKVRVEEWAKK